MLLGVVSVTKGVGEGGRGKGVVLPKEYNCQDTRYCVRLTMWQPACFFQILGSDTRAMGRFGSCLVQY